MKRLPISLVLLLLVAPLAAAPLTADEKELSVRYVLSLQNPDGGFRTAPQPGPSSVGATTSALRALRYFGGRTRLAPVRRFVESCAQPSGGFADTHGGKAEVRPTAVGLMALAELGKPSEAETAPHVRFLSENVKSMADAAIAAAALDTLGLKIDKRQEWAALYEATLTSTGTYGKSALDTAVAVNTLLRLGVPVRSEAAAARQILASQRPDGGFSAEGPTSDLASTYRVMRSLRLLKVKPDVAKVRAFVASCRCADGGYSATPGGASAGGATYFAAIVIRWLDEMGEG